MTFDEFRAVLVDATQNNTKHCFKMFYHAMFEVFRHNMVGVMSEFVMLMDFG